MCSAATEDASLRVASLATEAADDNTSDPAAKSQVVQRVLGDYQLRAVPKVGNRLL